MNDILEELNFKNRDDAVKFLKSLWDEAPQDCPICGGKLDYMHKKYKKSNCDWRCIGCGKIYKTISILDKINEKTN